MTQIVPLTVRIKVNGQEYEEQVEPRTLLVQLLREKLALTGTHIGCVVGECGACSVLVDGALVKSCLMLAVQANGREVTTVEGLAKNGAPHPVQEAFVKHFALQCGFCTPGFLMASYALLGRTANPTEEQIRKDLSSNLCMCTGYVQIVAAVKEAASVVQAWNREHT
jgi:aerobic carbon-monoxide dehydrogenase small subunit